MKLDIGSGVINLRQPLEEWTRVDVFEHELIDIVSDFGNLPIESGTVEEIWSGDSIEHIKTWELDKVMKEWNRVLKLGGRLCGQTPNLHSTMTRYVSGEIDLKTAIGALYGSQESEYQNHYMTYTPYTLQEMLWKYGFSFCDFSESPGSPNPMDSWWLVFRAIKTKDI